MENQINIQEESCLNTCKDTVLLLKTPESIFKQNEVNCPKSSESCMDNTDISINLLETMKHEKNRLSSFQEKWPIKFINAIELAKAGFFYLQLDDRVQCAYCALILYGWEAGDNPLKLHIKECPKCPFLAKSTRNLPTVSNNQVPLRYCSKLASRPTSSDSHRPKIPHMSDIKRRLSTFKGWPLTTITAEKLSDCGFYYTGQADVVVCFFCGASLGCWEPLDDPMVEHSKFFPNCGYLKLLCSRPMQKQTNMMKPGNIYMQNSEQSIKEAVASEFLKSGIVQEAKEFCPPKLVNGMLQHLKQTGKTFTSLDELIGNILDHEVDQLRISTEVKDEQTSRVSSQPETFKTKSVQDAFLCKICMDREMGIVFQPCGHLVTCEKCADLIFECPLCRKSIDTRVKTYLS